MGNCLEINDNQVLVQKVNGPVGGLSLTLDTKVADYTEDTVSAGRRREKFKLQKWYKLSIMVNFG